MNGIKFAMKGKGKYPDEHITLFESRPFYADPQQWVEIVVASVSMRRHLCGRYTDRIEIRAGTVNGNRKLTHFTGWSEIEK